MLEVPLVSEFPRSTPLEALLDALLEEEVVDVLDVFIVFDALVVVETPELCPASEVRSVFWVSAPLGLGVDVVAGVEGIVEPTEEDDEVARFGPSWTLNVHPTVQSATEKSAVESLAFMMPTLARGPASQQAVAINGAATGNSYSKGDPGGAVWVHQCQPPTKAPSLPKATIGNAVEVQASLSFLASIRERGGCVATAQRDRTGKFRRATCDQNRRLDGHSCK